MIWLNNFTRFDIGQYVWLFAVLRIQDSKEKKMLSNCTTHYILVSHFYLAISFFPTV